VEVGPLNDMEKTREVVNLCDHDERIRQVILMQEMVQASKPVYLSVAPEAFDSISLYLNERQYSFSVINEDLQKTYDAMMEKNEIAKEKWKKAGARTAPDVYLTYDEQVQWVQNAAAASSIAQTFNIGKSYEGRDMIGISINAGNTALPGIWIDANVHAREWVTSASLLYIIDQILVGTSADAVDMRTNYRWYILPNGNPDGYVYTWTTDRNWRKNRRDNSGSACFGVDCNRNWGENWGGQGSSALPCDDTYRGTSAFSEPETENMRQKLAEVASFTNVMISIHAYSQLWLVPWGGYSYKPADYNELMRVANLAVSAIQSVNGLRFQAGTPPDLLYVAAGGSFDYTKAQLGMVYSFSPEVRPATAAQGGFVLDESNIYPSGAEIFAAVVACAKNAQHKI
jgi:carboxypeptidase A2